MADGVSAVLEFDTADAFDSVDTLEARLTQVTQEFGVGLASAFDALGDVSPVEVPVDLTEAQAEVDALTSDPPPLDIAADLSSAFDELNALFDETGNVDVGADTDRAEAELAGLFDEVAVLEVQAETGQAQESIQGLTESATEAGAGLQGAAGGAQAFAGGLLGTTVNARALTAVGLGAFIADSVGEFAEAQGVLGTTEQILRNLGPAAGVSSEGVQALATDIQQLAGISDEETTAAAGLLASLQSVRNEQGQGNDIFDRTLRLSADFTVAYGTSMSGAARQLGKALADPERGISRLERSIGPLDAAVKENILSLTEQGDTLGAQRALLEALEERVGGVASAYGDTLAGQLDIAGEKFGEFQEDIGQIAGEALPFLAAGLQLLGPALDIVAAGFEGAFLIIDAIPTPVYAAAAAVAALYFGIPLLAGALLTLAANPVGAAVAALGLLAVTVGLVSDGTSSAEESAERLATAVDRFGTAYQDTGSSLRATTQAVQALRDADEDLDGILSLNGTTARQVANDFLNFTESADMSAVVDNALGSSQALEDLRDSLQAAAEEQYNAAIASGRLTDEQAITAYSTNTAAGETANYLAILEDLPPSAIRSAEAIQQIGDAAAQNLPTLSDALSNVRDETGVFAELAIATDPQLVVDNLNEMVSAFTDFTANIDILRGISPIVAEALAPLGPEVAGTFAAALAEAPPAITRNLEETLLAAEQAGLDLTAVLTGEFGGAADAGVDAIADKGPSYGAAGREVAGKTKDGFADVARGWPDQIGGFADDAIGEARKRRGDAREAGKSLSGGIESGLSSGAAEIAAAGRKLVAYASSAVLGQRGQAHAAGYGVGQSLGSGIASGIAASVNSIAGAAAKAVDEAEAAARRAADANSPSRLFASLGQDLGDGLAVGLHERRSIVAASAADLVALAASGVTTGLGLADSGVALATPGSSTESVVFGPGSIVNTFTGNPDRDEVAAGVEQGVSTALRRRNRHVDVKTRQRSS